jgi:hypothetical protein
VTSAISPIDQARKDDEVAEIADTEYFQDLQSRARSMRARHQTRDTHPETETKNAPSQTPEEPADPNAAKVA